MEKISRILPPSRRVTATDVESSQPVRPGAPDFGRPTQRLDIKDRVTLSALAADRAANERAGAGQGAEQGAESVTYRNPKEGARAKAVEELAEKFFNPASVAKSEGETVQSEEALKRLQENESFLPKLDQ